MKASDDLRRPAQRAWRRALPAPAMSAALFLAWLSWAESFSVAQAMLAAALAWALPTLSGWTRSPRPQLRRPGVALRLAAVVAADIVVSNLQVLRLVLGPGSRLQPRFVRLPLTLRDPHGIVTLASIITLTPGTVSADLTDDGRTLVIHALHCPDADALVTDIRQRYESPLREIFEP